MLLTAEQIGGPMPATKTVSANYGCLRSTTAIDTFSKRPITLWVRKGIPIPIRRGMHAMRENGTEGKKGLYILTVVLLASPFYLNDFANFYVKKWRQWLCVDYAGVIPKAVFKFT